jgi:hypothetical protein
MARSTHRNFPKNLGNEPESPFLLLGPREASSYLRIMAQRGAELIPVSLDPSPVIEAYKKDVDRTLLRENLKLTTAERVEKMIAVLRFSEEVRQSGKKAGAR